MSSETEDTGNGAGDATLVEDLAAGIGESGQQTPAPDEIPAETPPAPDDEIEPVLEQESQSPPAEYTASIFPGTQGTIPAEFAEAVLELEALFGCPVWLLVQKGRGAYDELNESVRAAFFNARDQLRSCGEAGGVVLLLDSPGGDAGAAYQIASMLRRHCGGFRAVVPRYAKSAATLLSLGAYPIFLGRDAHLGPLDAQLWDGDREEYGSALDEVQALERLNSVALDFVDQAMFLLVGRTRKKVDVLLPAVLKYSSDLMQPLLDKIDTIHYTQRSRVLKVAEDYATRLLRSKYSEDDAKDIARRLVNGYPEHGFVIDREELESIVPELLAPPDDDKQAVVDRLETFLTNNHLTALGHVERREVQHDSQ